MYALGKLFPSKQTIFIKILSVLWSRKVIVFLDTLLKRNNRKIFVLADRKPTHIDQYIHYRSHNLISRKESVVSSLVNTAYSINANKIDIYKGNARIKQV